MATDRVVDLCIDQELEVYNRLLETAIVLVLLFHFLFLSEIDRVINCVGE